MPSPRTRRTRAAGALVAVLLAAQAGAADAAKQPAQTVRLAWVTVGAPGNAPDEQVAVDGTSGYGDVARTFRIARHEVTNEQYAAFLNAKASSDPTLLYHPFMDRAKGFGEGSGIVQDGPPGSHTYAVDPGRERRPVNYVSVFDAMRFLNWLHNGQGDGDTETGAYTLQGGTPVPANAATVARNPGARFFLPTDDEWYKAAYYDPRAGRYWDYPTGTDDVVTCAAPGPEPGTANCGGAAGDEQIAGGAFTDAGAYTGSPSPFGTYDQAGNVFEWTESRSSTSPTSLVLQTPAVPGLDGPFQSLRGSSYIDDARFTSSAQRNTVTSDSEFAAQGFRVAATKR